ncbi:MAG TPA: LanC-like protein [Gaiellaceae bacterium]
MTLYRPEAFEPLVETEWDEHRARAGIRTIVADTESAFRGPRLYWQADEWDRWHATSPMKNLYVGTAGVLWALDRLQRFGYAETTLDLPTLAARNVELFRERPDFMNGMKLPEPAESGLLTGETGVLVVACLFAREATLADDLFAHVRANVDNEAEEVMWGAPGTLLAARAMWKSTDDERWRSASRDTAEAVMSRRGRDGLWTQRLYGRELRMLTPPHGLVGIVQALLPSVGDDKAAALRRETAGTLHENAVVEGGLANWPPVPRPELPGPDGQIRVQWCAGSPGIVTSASTYLDDELLLAGAELPWRTGPPTLDKGSGICHGTAGNGYAFLKAFERLGDELWLSRARRFAMHALEQVERLRRQRGRGRYSLFTGDLGAALYIADCVSGRGVYPVLEEL